MSDFLYIGNRSLLFRQTGMLLPHFGCNVSTSISALDWSVCCPSRIGINETKTNPCCCQKEKEMMQRPLNWIDIGIVEDHC